MRLGAFDVAINLDPVNNSYRCVIGFPTETHGNILLERTGFKTKAIAFDWARKEIGDIVTKTIHALQSVPYIRKEKAVNAIQFANDGFFISGLRNTEPGKFTYNGEPIKFGDWIVFDESEIGIVVPKEDFERDYGIKI
jgi:hypothetical protein